MRIPIVVSAVVLLLMVGHAMKLVAQETNQPTEVKQPLPEKFDTRKPDEGKKEVVDLQNPIEVMRVGGALMWPILLCSVVTFTFALERFVMLRRGRVIPNRFLNPFMVDLESGKLTRDSAVERCRSNGSPVALVILSAVRRWGRPMSEIEQAINEGGEREVLSLRRNLRALHGSANLSTLLGLLGTVIGMILAFNQVAVASGQPRAEMLSTGIAQALLTTAFGLAVAIPSLFLHAYFSGRVERLVYEIDQRALLVAERISLESGAKEIQPDGAPSAVPRLSTSRAKADHDMPATPAVTRKPS
jgi:biopolymer transport protein ExbB